MAPFAGESFEVMAAMSRAAGRPLNWNVLQVYGRNTDVVDHLLTASDFAADHGGAGRSAHLAGQLPDVAQSAYRLLARCSPGLGSAHGLA